LNFKHRPGCGVVLQVAIISEYRWFDNQHPSSVDDYNDPSRTTTLSKACDRLEVTLNKDLGSQYVETHQLVIPPVQFLTAEKTQLLSSVATRHLSMSSEEYHTCVEIIEDVICKAQVLLECVHDALTDVGVDGIGKMFSSPISLIRDEQDTWMYKVQGSYIDEAVDVSVNTADIRKRFMQATDHSGDMWLYPAPHTEHSESSAASCLQPEGTDDNTVAPAPAVDRVDRVDQPAGEAVAESALASIAEGGSAEEQGLSVTVGNEPINAAREKVQGMPRTDSWTEDKFTVMPGRTQFPALSDRNFLLEEMDVSSADDDAEPETADSSDNGAPGTPDSPCPPLFQGKVSHDRSDAAPSAVAEGVRCSKLMQVITAKYCTEGVQTQQALTLPAFADRDAVDPARAASEDLTRLPEDALATAPSGGDVGAKKGPTQGLISNIDARSVRSMSSMRSSVTAPGEAISEHVMSINPDLARSLSELKLHSSELEFGNITHESSCNAPEHKCKLRQGRTGILLYPDDGTRMSERHVMLQRLPPLLLCHFNRFQHSMLGTRKVTTHVSFPFQLYVHPTVASRPEHSRQDDSCAVRYRLKAVLEHHGRQASSGHYTSYVWRPSAVVKAASMQAAGKAGTSNTDTTPALSTSMKARAHPRDIERPRSQLKGGSQTSGSLNDSSSVQEPHSVRQMAGSSFFESSRGSSLTEASENIFTPGSSLRQVSSVTVPKPMPNLPELPRNDADSIEADLSVADWEELADIPAGLSCNTEPITNASAESVDGESDTDGGVRCKEDGEVSSPSALKSAADEVPSLQNLLAEDEDEDSGMWLKCDDECVEEVPWQTVSSAQAYMLMYEQTLCSR
jgi:hypothetical protein